MKIGKTIAFTALGLAVIALLSFVSFKGVQYFQYILGLMNMSLSDFASYVFTAIFIATLLACLLICAYLLGVWLWRFIGKIATQKLTKV